jgi:hypothetical protein
MQTTATTATTTNIQWCFVCRLAVVLARKIRPFAVLGVSERFRAVVRE